MKKFRSVAMLLSVMTGLVVIMLVSVFATSAVNAYSRMADANYTLLIVHRTGEVLALKETARTELYTITAALREKRPASPETLSQIARLHLKCERLLQRVANDLNENNKVPIDLGGFYAARRAYEKLPAEIILSLQLPEPLRSKELIENTTAAIVRLLEAVDLQSAKQLENIENGDTVISEMTKVNDLAWKMRDTAGTDRRRLITAILDGRVPTIEQREAFSEADGEINALWSQIEFSDREHSFPAPLKAAFENARREYIAKYRLTRSGFIAKLTRGQPINLSIPGFAVLTNPGLSSLIAISKGALVITERHATQQARLAHQHFNTAIGLMLVSICFASFAMMYVLWRVIMPLKKITRTIHAIANGDMVQNIPFAHREDEIGQFARALRLFRDSADIQQRLETESLRNLSAKNAAETSNRLKSEFLANMSHELRTPLNAILGFSEMIGTEVFGPGLPRYRAYADDIHSAGAHLLSLINDILDLSKAEAGRLELRGERFDVTELINECLHLVGGQVTDHGLDIKSRLDHLPELFADRLRVKQILLNILANAIKFTAEGGHLSVEAAQDLAGQVAIRVSDTGIGIAPEKLRLVFEPFRQVDSALSRKFGGTGLGLSLVRSLTELHGGKVGIESTLGIGTTVSITFPVTRSMAPRRNLEPASAGFISAALPA